MKGLKVGLPLLVALSVALGPAFLPRSPQEALAAQPIRTGQADAEMMIWLNVRGLYNPAGMGWPVVRIDGALWYVLTWITGNGHQQWRYVQFRKYTPRWNVTGLSLQPFYQYMENQGWITPSWYALNVEAGFEIWSGGTGLTTTAFSET